VAVVAVLADAPGLVGSGCWLPGRLQRGGVAQPPERGDGEDQPAAVAGYVECFLALFRVRGQGALSWLTIMDLRRARCADLQVSSFRRPEVRAKPGP
jgi:hypothetical protein